MSPTLSAIETSTPQDIIVTFPTHLFPPTIPTASELRLSNVPSSPGARGSPLLLVVFLVHRCHALEVESSRLPSSPFAPGIGFAGSESLVHSPAGLLCRTLGRNRHWLARLVPLVSKASVSNILITPQSHTRPTSPCYGPFVGYS